ncbi:MAG: serine/threonine-protein kinase, partial [Thermodesulfobacteriota bacterium]
MGEVYKARDTRLDRTVAIKILPAHFAENERLRQRFEREARALASLTHPHICTLYDVGHEDDIHFLVMEYLEGETLASRLERGPLPTEQVVRAGIEIAGALDKAHRQGVVHRDLKPGNIMLTKAGVKLLDFGLAKGTANLVASALTQVSVAPTQTQPLTAEGTLVGTLHYMAPEQLEGQEADARSDLFALGAVLYEMATGRRAFLGKSQASIIAAILSSEPAPMVALQPMAPPALDRAVKRCLAKDAEERWQSARDLLLELKWIAEVGSAAEAPAGGKVGRPNRERLAWLAAVIVLAAALGLAVARLREPPSEDPVARFSVSLPEKTA